jgi:hypothetical protein
VAGLGVQLGLATGAVSAVVQVVRVQPLPAVGDAFVQVAGSTTVGPLTGVKEQVTVGGPEVGVQDAPGVTTTVGVQVPVQVGVHCTVGLAVQLDTVVAGPRTVLQVVVTLVVELYPGVQVVTTVLVGGVDVQVCEALLTQVEPSTNVDSTGPQATLADGVQDATQVGLPTTVRQSGVPNAVGGKAAGHDGTETGPYVFGVHAPGGGLAEPQGGPTFVFSLNKYSPQELLRL